MKVVQRGGTGRDTVVSCDNPVDLMRQLLIQLGGSATLDQLCQVNKQLINVFIGFDIVSCAVLRLRYMVFGHNILRIPRRQLNERLKDWRPETP